MYTTSYGCGATLGLIVARRNNTIWMFLFI